MSCHQECQLERLLLVQPRIAIRRVVQAQILIHQSLTPSGALCDRISSKLKMHTTQEGAVLLVDLESRRELREDAVERASLDTGWCAAGVAM
jgi:hypothetical protein